MHRITNLTARPLHLMLRNAAGELQPTVIPPRNGSVVVPSLGTIAGHLTKHGTVLVERVEEPPAAAAEVSEPMTFAAEKHTEDEGADDDDDRPSPGADDSPPQSPEEPEPPARRTRRARSSRPKEIFEP